MAAFSSALLLSDEAILKLGVKEHAVEIYRRRHYQASFGIDTWYSALKQHTFRSEMFDLSFSEATAILECHSNKNPNKDTLLCIKNKLDDILARFPNGAFVKLDTRSPKDVPVYAFENEIIKQFIDEELQVFNEEQLEDEDEKTAAFVRATNKYLRVVNGDEALSLLVLSTRVAEDLSKAVEFGEKLFYAKMVVREWLDEVPDHPEMEFRGFVHKNKLNALTQYFSFVRFPYLERNKEAIAANIQQFFNSVKHLIPHESYVIDFFLIKDKVFIIELNPFHHGAGAGLFSWRENRQLFMEGPFEFRIATGPPSERKPYDVLPFYWQRYIDNKCARQLRRNKIGFYVPVVAVVAYSVLCIVTYLKK